MRSYMSRFVPVLMVLLALFLTACGSPRINLVPDYNQPLKESTLSGEAREKILVVQVDGLISTRPGWGLLHSRPSMVQRIASQLDKASQDEDIKAMVLIINSPGGSATASNILFHELMRYKTRSKVPVVACFMDIAASGGYYAAMAADVIVAHPTSTTGSVGTIFMRVKVVGLMDKIGVEVDVTKSGEYKDLASPFAESTPERDRIIQNMIDELNEGFVSLVQSTRKLSPDTMLTVADGRVFTADQAAELRLVDSIGYVEDALAMARKMAKLPADASVITYRRTVPDNDTLYNTSTTKAGSPLSALGTAAGALSPTTGFYYLWTPEYK